MIPILLTLLFVLEFLTMPLMPGTRPCTSSPGTLCPWRHSSPIVIKRHYEHNKSYQRPPLPVSIAILEEVHIPSEYAKYLGNEKHYHDFLIFFQAEIDKKSRKGVSNECVLQGDERAEDMLGMLVCHRLWT